MSIAILCPTRGRPEQFKRMVESVKKTSLIDVRIYSALTLKDFKKYDTNGISFNPCQEDETTVYKWNYLSSHAYCGHEEVKLFMLGADDTIFATPDWDKALLDHYNNLENKIHVYALQDSRDPEGTPHPIVTREYIDAMGYFMPPIFLHWFIDTWTVEIAKSNNCFTHLKDFELIHDKPSDNGQADETHNRIRRMGWHERDKYVNDTCHHFLEFEKNRLGAIIRHKHGEV